MNGFINIRSESTGDVPVNKPKLAVYNAGTEVTLKLDPSTTGAGTSKFAGADTQLVIARLKPNITEARSWNNRSRLNETKDDAEARNRSDNIQRAMDLLTMENANENATFWVKDSGPIGSDGNLTTTFTPQQSGEYVVFLATVDNGDGFSATDGNLSVSGDTTVIGMDAVAAQTKTAAVAVSNKNIIDNHNSFKLGKKVYFEADSKLKGDQNISHVMVLYKSDEFKDSQSKMTISGEIDRNMTEDQVDVTHSVKYLYGAGRIRDHNYTNEDALGGEIHEVNFGDGKMTGTLTVESLAYAIADETAAVNDSDVSDATDNIEPTSESVLDASSTVVVTATPKQFTGLRVDTVSDWEEGSYRWVYVAVGDEGEQVSTDTSTIELRDGSSGNNGDDGNNGDGDDGDDTNNGGGFFPPVGGTGSTSNPPSTLTGVSSSNGHATVSVTNVYAGEPVDVHFTSSQIANDAFEMEGIEILPNGDMDGFDLTITPLDAAPDDVPSIETRMGAELLSYFRIDHTVSNDDVDGVTYTFSVEKSALNGQDPNNVVLYRYNDGNWNTVQTKLVSESGSSYTYESDSPGLSVYAIGVQQPNINVDNAELEQSTIEPGNTAKVSVTVSNTGEGKGTKTLELTANGNALSETQITLGAGETTTITLSQTFDDAGDYDIAVNGESAGALSVQGAANPDDDGSDDTTQPMETPDDEQEGGIGGAAWVLLAIVLIAIGAGGVYYVREQQ